MNNNRVSWLVAIAVMALAGAVRSEQVAVVGLGPGTNDVAAALAKQIENPAVKIVPALTASQALSGHVDHSTMPDVVLVVRHATEDAAEWRMSVCDVATGACLGDNVLVLQNNAAPPVQDMAAMFAKQIAKPSKPDTATAIVLPMDNADFSRVNTGDGVLARRALEESLSANKVAEMDLRDAWIIGEQRAAAGLPAINVPEPLIFSGQIKHLAQGGQFTVTLALSYEGKKISDWTSQPMTAEGLADQTDQGVAKLLEKVPAGGNQNRKPGEVQQTINEAAQLLASAGDLEEAAQVQEEALLFEPGNPAIHREAARNMSAVVWARLTAYANTNPNKDYFEYDDPWRARFCNANADEITWAIYHMQMYAIASKIKIFNGSEITDLNDLSGIAPADQIRASIYNVMKAKHAAKQADDFPKVMTYLIQRSNHYHQTPVMTLDQIQVYAEQLGDVWTFSGHTAYELDSTLPFLGQWTNQAEDKLLAHMMQSSNPDAHLAADDLRKMHEKTAADLKRNATMPATALIDQGPAVLKTQGIAFPSALHDTSYGIITAGPHADAFYCGHENHAALYYFCADGSGRKVGTMWRKSKPVFDGKYLWFVGVEKDAPVLSVYDPPADKIWVDSNGDYPHDAIVESRFAAIEPGYVCLAAEIGGNVSRSWVGLLKLDPASGINTKVVLTCTRPAAPENSPESRKISPVDTVFEVRAIAVMPGPPGAGADAKPQVYIFRLWPGVILVNPEDGNCSVVDSKGFKSAPWSAVWQEKEYCSARVWDVRENKVSKIPYMLTQCLVDGKIYGFDNDGYFYQTEPGGKPKLLSSGSRPMFTHPPEVEYSHLFGLICDSGVQFASLPGHNDLPTPEVTDPPKYFRAFAERTGDSEIYWRLAWMDNHADPDSWASDMAGAIKYYQAGNENHSGLEHARDECDLAEYFMHRGNHAAAKPYAYDAAETGAEWALQSKAYVAEGLGEWNVAEQSIRQAGDGYGNALAWYSWCTRTAHGDLAAARAQALDFADHADPPQKGTGVRAWVDLFDGNLKDAKTELELMATDGKDAQAAICLAFIADDAKDSAERDKMLDLAAVDTVGDGIRPTPLVALIKKIYATKGQIDVAALKKSEVGLDDLYEPVYFNGVGRAFLSVGEKEKAIFYLQHAAGCNSYRISRTAAAVKLRELNAAVPKPGQWDEDFKGSK